MLKKSMKILNFKYVCNHWCSGKGENFIDRSSHRSLYPEIKTREIKEIQNMWFFLLYRCAFFPLMVLIFKKKTAYSNSENCDSTFTLSKADQTWKQPFFICRNSSNRKIVYANQTVLCSLPLKCVQLPSLSCRNCDSFRSKFEEKVRTLIFVAKNRVTSPIMSFYSLDVCLKYLRYFSG